MARSRSVDWSQKCPADPGVIDEKIDWRNIAAEIPPSIASFLLTSLQDAASIIAQQKRCRVNILQLCDSVGSGLL